MNLGALYIVTFIAFSEQILMSVHRLLTYVDLEHVPILLMEISTAVLVKMEQHRLE